MNWQSHLYTEVDLDIDFISSMYRLIANHNVTTTYLYVLYSNSYLDLDLWGWRSESIDYFMIASKSAKVISLLSPNCCLQRLSITLSS